MTNPALSANLPATDATLQLIKTLLAGVLTIGLPVGAAKESGGNLDTIAAKISAAATALAGTLEVSATALPLPSGAAKEAGGNLDTIAAKISATAAAQATGNAALGAIATPFAAATSAAVSGTQSGPGTTIVGPFTPNLTRPIHIEAVGSGGAAGTVQVMRSIDGGVTKNGLTAAGATWASFTAANGVIANEPVWSPTSALEIFYVVLTLTAGSVTAELFQ
ncbi:MAG: hypothetical protein P4L68_08300 [Methylovirgula sp.]|nr:hypothetical protein [Methylovirgula sp.]